MSSLPDSTTLLLCLIYNDYKSVAEFLEHTIQSANGHQLRIVVSDNTPGGDPTNVAWLGESALNALNDSLFIIGDGTNRGYYGGFRHGLAFALSKWNTHATWTVITNTDLKIATPNWIGILKSIKDANIAAIAPQIISLLSSKNQNPLYKVRPSPTKFLFLSYIFSSLPLTVLHRIASLVKGRLTASLSINRISDSTTIYAAHGSLVCLSANYFKNGGQLKCPAFLYCEELFLAEEVASLGMKIVYTDKLQIYHQEHATTSFIPPKSLRKHLSEAHHMAYEILKS